MRPRIVRFMTFDEIQRLIDVLRSRADVLVITGPQALERNEVVEPPSAFEDGAFEDGGGDDPFAASPGDGQ